MKKLKQQHRKIARIVFAVLVVLLLASTAYTYRQVTELEGRVTMLEERTEESYVSDDGVSDISDETIDVTFVSRATERLRVETAYRDDGPVYEEKEVQVFTVKIHNGSSSAYDVSMANIRAQTNNGVLLARAAIHPEDSSEPALVELAPGGEVEVVLYYVTSGNQEITNLFHEAGMGSGIIKFN